MGYKTDFWGEIKVTPQPDDEFVEKFNAFCEGRHSDSDSDDGGSRSPDNSCTKYPSRWCYWFLYSGDDSEGVVLKMPDYEDNVENVSVWLSYLIQNWFKPNGYKLSGTVYAMGEGANDFWKISVRGPTVKVHKGRTTYNGGHNVRWTPPPVLKSRIDRSKVQPDATA